MNARDLMTTHVLTCRSDERLTSAARLMWEGDVGVVVAVDDRGRLAGLATDRDLCMAAYTQGRSLDEIRLIEIMSHDVVTCRPEDSLGRIEEAMRTHQIRRIVVVDDERRPVGVVSINDLVRAVDGARRGQGELIATLAAIGRHRDALAPGHSTAA